MTTSLPATLDHFRPRTPDAGRRAAQRIIHAGELALGIAAACVWAYAVFSFISG